MRNNMPIPPLRQFDRPIDSSHVDHKRGESHSRQQIFRFSEMTRSIEIMSRSQRDGLLARAGGGWVGNVVGGGTVRVGGVLPG